MNRGKSVFAPWPSSVKFYKRDGTLPEEGAIFAEPDLVLTLRAMVKVEEEHASQGRNRAIDAVRDYFYRDPIAYRISEFCMQAGCLLRETDFSRYRAAFEQPLHTTYHGIEVYKAGFWTQGPAFLEV